MSISMPPIFMKSYRTIQTLLNASTPYVLYRWLGFVTLALLFAIRIYFIQRFFLVTYGVAIYFVQLAIFFTSPKEDPVTGGPILPVSSDEKTGGASVFLRKLGEFSFWFFACRAVLVGFSLTLVPALDIPVFWPILVLYFLILLGYSFKNRVQHMIKYGYVPFSMTKKKQYDVKEPISEGKLFTGASVTKPLGPMGGVGSGADGAAGGGGGGGGGSNGGGSLPTRRTKQ